jgi:hypothetical protein
VPIFSRHWLDPDGRPDVERLRKQGPALTVEISVPSDLAAESPQSHVGLALIDTGASVTSVNEAPLRALGLRPTGVTEVATPSSPGSRQPVYPCVLSFPGTPLPAIPFNEVVASDLTAFGVSVLIGRDILAHCQFIYNGPEGFWTIAF